MQSLTDYQLDESFGLLIEGPPKTGKTTLALQFEAPFIIDCSNNLSGAIRVLRKIPGVDLSNIKFGRPWMFEDEKIVPIENRWERLLALLNEGGFKDPTRKTIIIDDIGEVCEYLQAFIVKGKEGSGKKEGMTISDWIPFRSLLSKLVKDCRMICRKSRYFIVTAHEEYAKDERTGAIFTRVNIPSKLADNFGGMFSDAWQTFVQDNGDTSKYLVRAMASVATPQIGNSLGLPKEFTFEWAKFLPYLKGTK